MAEKMVMLALSPTMDEGVIAGWRKKEGESVSSGEVVCEVETDKAVMEYESQVEGTLLKITVGEGGGAAVGETIAIVGEEGEDISALVEEAAGQQAGKEKAGGRRLEAGGEEKKKAGGRRPEAGGGAAARREQESSGAGEQGREEKKRGGEEAVGRMPAGRGTEGWKPSAREEGKPSARGEGREEVRREGPLRSSPLARGVAEELGVDISEVEGSGPHGRVVVADVEAAAERGVRGEGRGVREERMALVGGPMVEEEIAVTQKRRIIAQRLSESKYTRPHYYLTVSARVDELLAARQAYNAKAKEKVSFNAYLIKLVAEALKRHRLVNSTWDEDRIVMHGRVDMAVAVEQEDGLITPVIRNCEGKGVLQIDDELRGLVEKARSNKLQPEEYSDSTFTITNLGSFGIEEFTAIINPPNTAILAVGEVKRQAVVGDDGVVGVASMMKLTLACDHRVVDGAKGARFLTALREMVERPVLALM